MFRCEGQLIKLLSVTAVGAQRWTGWMKSHFETRLKMFGPEVIIEHKEICQHSIGNLVLQMLRQEKVWHIFHKANILFEE